MSANQDLVPSASRLPTSTHQGLAARIQAYRRETGTFLLLDVSGSMDERLSREERAIDKLRKVARDLRNNCPTVRQIVFPAGPAGPACDQARELAGDIPEPGGTTPLAAAIRLAASHGALHLLIVSDGEPTDKEAARQAAQAAKCQIDVCYIGRPGDAGEGFLRELARQHGGSCDTLDLRTKQLETKIRGLLGVGAGA